MRSHPILSIHSIILLCTRTVCSTTKTDTIACITPNSTLIHIFHDGLFPAFITFIMVGDHRQAIFYCSFYIHSSLQFCFGCRPIYCYYFSVNGTESRNNNVAFLPYLQKIIQKRLEYDTSLRYKE